MTSWLLVAWLLTAGAADIRSAAAEPGAKTADHWAFRPVERPGVPTDFPGLHPIDAFVRSALQARGLAPNPPAAPRDLVRRLHWDLVGLPPEPQVVDEFVRDPSPERYAALVERLLASPRHGERWARHWLDVVRYTESQGFEYDRLRDHAWPYRDYVIRSFNADLPYDRFLREQVAGDVLEPVRSEGIVASSLLVSGPWDQAGNSQANATQRAITREEEMDDLVSVVTQTFLGLTVNCARCHDHKFDPIPLADYYRVKAVFDGVRHGDRPIEGAEDIHRREARKEALRQEIRREERRIAAIEARGAARIPRDARVAVSAPVPVFQWQFAHPSSAELPGEPKGGARVGGGVLDLPKPGAYFQSAPLPRDLREKTLSAWVRLSDLLQSGGAAISIERGDGRVFDAIVFGEQHPRKWMAGSEGFQRTRDVGGPEETATPTDWVHVAAVYSADRKVTLYRNGQPYGQPYEVPELLTFTAGDARIALGRRHEGGGKPWLTGAIRQAAVHDRALMPTEIAALFQEGGGGPSLALVLARLAPTEQRDREAALQRIEATRKRVQAEDKPGTLAYAGRREQPAPTRVLRRGDVKSPADTVSPAGLSALGPLPGDLGVAPDAPEAERRRRFADWLADPRNPLPARVMVNRVWGFHFGQGLVPTPSDFGRSGVGPSHPELLDWLATEFVSRGWSLKALHRLIVSSETYRQSSASRPGALETDADAILLWRFPPRRLEAEAIRDGMLAVSGELNLQLGGPSFRPFTTSEYGATFYHLVDRGTPDFNRRTVYRMNINSGKEPLLDALDCPDPSVRTPRRGITTTPLQALGLMNSGFVLRQADHLARRARAAAGGEDAGTVETLWRLVLGRAPDAREARMALEAGRDRGWDHVAWVLLNTTEFVYVR
ncbi:MAG: DUF1553 domain-containing protein [Verrucomicrobium sp.]|nr:DUF1553 domain-containing protein [Verrucomicrobium sp.]